MAKETMNYNQLFAGKVEDVVNVPVSAATIKRGDVLVAEVTDGVVATAFKKATEDAKVGNIYVVAAESVTNHTGMVAAYGHGYFDAYQLKINDAAATEASKLALMASQIYVLTTN